MTTALEGKGYASGKAWGRDKGDVRATAEERRWRRRSSTCVRAATLGAADRAVTCRHTYLGNSKVGRSSDILTLPIPRVSAVGAS